MSIAASAGRPARLGHRRRQRHRPGRRDRARQGRLPGGRLGPRRGQARRRDRAAPKRAARRPARSRRAARRRRCRRRRARRRRDRRRATAGVDILVNSAGVNFPKRYWNETDSATFDERRRDQPERRDRLHAGGAARDAAAPAGTVINVASFAGWYLGYLTGPAYTASKAGDDRADPFVQHRGVRQRPARHGALPGRGRRRRS